MYSTIKAVADLLSVFFEEKAKEEKPIPTAQPVIKTYIFTCYLCSAQTKFTTEPVINKTYYKVDCCRCGYENPVVVTPEVAKS